MNEKIPSFLKEDYLESAEPYAWVYNRADSPLREMQLCQLVSEKAKLVGVKNFNKLYTAYKKSVDILNKNRKIRSPQEQRLIAELRR